MSPNRGIAESNFLDEVPGESVALIVSVWLGGASLTGLAGLAILTCLAGMAFIFASRS